MDVRRINNFDLWTRPWDVDRLLGLGGDYLCPHPSKVVNCTITPFEELEPKESFYTNP